MADAQEKVLGDVIILLTLDLGERIMPSIVNDSYQKALDDARKELADLPRQRQLAAEFFDRREDQLKKIIEGLEPVCESVADGQSPAYTQTIFDLIAEDYEPGLQQAIEAVIRANSPNPMEPTQIRDALERAGVNTKNYSNPMATIHRALKRLHDSPGSPVTYHEVGGKKLYGWVPKTGFKEAFKRGLITVPTEADIQQSKIKRQYERLSKVPEEPK